jgi:hypothetical protein
LRAPINNLLNFNLTPSKRFHALINAAGGIATAGIYNLNFDQGGLRHLTASVSYAIHQAYDTWEQAFAQVCQTTTIPTPTTFPHETTTTAIATISPHDITTVTTTVTSHNPND